MSTYPLLWAIILAFAVCPLCFGLQRYSAKTLQTVDFESNRASWTFWRAVFRLCIPASVIAAVLLAYNGLESANSTGVALETQLNQQYAENINTLSMYSTGFEEQLGVSDLHDARLKAIITAAISGQATLKNMQAPGESPLFIALTQAYPNISLPQYTKLLDYIEKGRQQFQEGQLALLQDLSAFDKWRNSGVLIHPAVVRAFGYPNDLLTMTVGGQTLHGAAAEAQMWHIVESPYAIEAYSTGVQKPLSIPKE